MIPEVHTESLEESMGFNPKDSDTDHESTPDVSSLLDRIAQMQRELDELRCFRDMAYRDPLTGLRNRRYLELRVAEELHRVKRKPNGHCSVVMIDLDDLKVINDELGHAEGDRSLKWIGNFLTAELRQQDVCCRIGGDEFVLVLPDTDTLGRRLVVDRIWDNLRKANVGREVPLRLSMGGATWPMDGQVADELLNKADRAMYRSKRRNKGTAPRSRVGQPKVALAD